MIVLVQLLCIPSISYLVLTIFTNLHVRFLSISLFAFHSEFLLQLAIQDMPQNLYSIQLLLFFIFWYTCSISKQILSLFGTFITLWFKYQTQKYCTHCSFTQKHNDFTFWTFYQLWVWGFCVCLYMYAKFTKLFYKFKSSFRSPKWYLIMWFWPVELWKNVDDIKTRKIITPIPRALRMLLCPSPDILRGCSDSMVCTWAVLTVQRALESLKSNKVQLRTASSWAAYPEDTC